MKVGDYVRTTFGIAKYIGKQLNSYCVYDYILDEYITNYIDAPGNCVAKRDIIKSSPNIIDLIEVGDYVNGCPVLLKANNELVCGLLLRYKEENIESIVTKEQFESMKYEVE